MLKYNFIYNGYISYIHTCQIGRNKKFSFVYVLDWRFGGLFHNNLRRKEVLNAPSNRQNTCAKFLTYGNPVGVFGPYLRWFMAPRLCKTVKKSAAKLIQHHNIVHIYDPKYLRNVPLWTSTSFLPKFSLKHQKLRPFSCITVSTLNLRCVLMVLRMFEHVILCYFVVLRHKIVQFSIFGPKSWSAVLVMVC